MKLRLAGVVAAVVLVGSFLLLTAGAPAIWPDRTVPAAYSGQVDQARAAIREKVDGLRWPHFRLAEIRCRADGGVAYVFDQIEAPYLDTRFASAVTATWPPSGWMVGVTLTQRNDSELLYFLGADEVACAGN